MEKRIINFDILVDGNGGSTTEDRTAGGCDFISFLNNHPNLDDSIKSSLSEPGTLFFLNCAEEYSKTKSQQAEESRLFNLLKGKDFRLENDDDGFYLSIVDRSKYPRVWIDNAIDNPQKMIAESVEHIEQRTNPFLEKDWSVRYFGKTIEDLILQLTA